MSELPYCSSRSLCYIQPPSPVSHDDPAAILSASIPCVMASAEQCFDPSEPPGGIMSGLTQETDLIQNEH